MNDSTINQLHKVLYDKNTNHGWQTLWVYDRNGVYLFSHSSTGKKYKQSGNTYLYDDAPTPSNPLPSNVNYYERNYDYDKLGNINSVVQTGTNGFTRDYTYNTGVNTLQKIENSTPTTIESYTYDACGNTATTNLNRFYVWDHADRLLCYYNDAGGGPTVFTQYDYSGNDRVSKMVRTGTTYERTIYIDGIFEYVKLENGTTYEKNYIHIMDDKSRIAEVRIDGGTGPFPGDIANKTIYIVEDQIGSSVMRLSTSGTIIDEEEYYPFGDSSLRTFTYKRYRYVGKERDAESGLYYYGARYYAAWTCRFISVDPLAHDYMYLTPYNYAGNRPIISIDIDGMQGDQNTSDKPTNNGNTNKVGSVQGDEKIPESNKIDCHGAGSKDTTHPSVKDLINNLKGTKSNVLTKEEVGKISDWVKDNATGPKRDLTLSKEGLDFIKEAEGGFKDKVYDAKTGKDAKFDKDGKIIGSGDWTVGYGHKLTGDEIKNQSYNSEGITESQGESLLLKDAKSSIDRINKLANGELTQNQFDALVSFAFQQGNYNKTLTNIMKSVNGGKFEIAADLIKNTGNKKSRREAESEMFKNRTYLPPSSYYKNKPIAKREKTKILG